MDDYREPTVFCCYHFTMETASDPKNKDVIIESLRFLVKKNRVVVYGFIIMPNHIHLICQKKEGIIPAHVQPDFLVSSDNT